MVLSNLFLDHKFPVSQLTDEQINGLCVLRCLGRSR